VILLNDDALLISRHDWTPVGSLRSMAHGEQISKEQAAALLGVSPRTLLRYAEAGYVRKRSNPITSRVHYYRSDILRFKRLRERDVPTEQLAS